MTYGIFQEYYLTHWKFQGSKDTAGVIGTTFNGVMYLSMPLLFSLFNRRYARFRRTAAICGVVIACVGFIASSFSTDAWHLVLTQGVLAPLGCVLIYSPTTLVLSESYSQENRALAYGIVLACKNVTGTTCPFLMQHLLEKFGFRTTLRIWAGITAAISLISIPIMPVQPPTVYSSTAYRSRRVPWHFLQHSPIYVYSIATIFQSSGYGIAQTYINTYAQSIASLSATSSTLLLTLFNGPGILSCYFFGLLSDNKRRPFSATATTFLSAIGAGLAAFFLWGFAGASGHSMIFLVLFAIIYGFFAGAYSTCWGTVIKEMEREAAGRNEAIDSGLVYGFLNGARGIGYVSGGLFGVELLKVGNPGTLGKLGGGTSYGPLILYTGLSTAVGGWSILLKGKPLLRTVKCWT